MLLEGRKHPRTSERFLVQVSSAHDPRGASATERSWELGSHVDVEAIARELRARACVVYCKALGPKKFAVGLNLITREDGQAKPPKK